MANYGQPNVTVNFDNSGGTPVNISNQVMTISAIDKEIALEESDAMGDAWAEFLSAAVSRMAEITLGGLYDDTAATSVNALAGGNSDLGAIRTLQVVFGSTKSITVECLIKNFRRLISRGELHKYELVLQPTGTPTEA